MQVQCHPGEKAGGTASKAVDSATRVAPRTRHAPPGFEHFQADPPSSTADTPISANNSTDTSAQSSGSRAQHPPPVFEDWQHVPAPPAVVSLQSADSTREDAANGRDRSSTARAESRASSGELDPAILAMLLPKAPEQVLPTSVAILNGL